MLRFRASPLRHLHLPSRASPPIRFGWARSLSQPAVRTSEGVQYHGQTFPYLWLRDTCQCPRCLHPSTKQKLHRSSDFELESQPKDFKASAEGVNITWQSGHESFYPSEFLERYSSAAKRREFHKDTERVPWDFTALEKSPSLFVPYDSLQRPDGLLKAVTQILQYGLLFISGVPNSETSNDACELRTLATKFGELRETFYGPLWDVINRRNSTNIAYTNLFLDLHMDLLYFQHPPRYQILHCLRNRVDGGSSVFVDALHAAESLRKPDTINLYKTLATTPVHFHYINDGEHYHHSHPTIELDHDAADFTSPTENKPIKCINYSPPFQAPLSPETGEEFYRALKAFVARLEAPGAKFEYRLREGDAVVFDNRRVLHARTAFTEKKQDGQEEEGSPNEPNRWLKGCYIEEDAMLSLRRGLVERT